MSLAGRQLERVPKILDAGAALDLHGGLGARSGLLLDDRLLRFDHRCTALVSPSSSASLASRLRVDDDPPFGRLVVTAPDP